MLTLDKIYHAAFVLKKVARKTDLIKATKLSDHCDLYLKTENLQETGSFKLRGAYYKISQLTDEEKSHGILSTDHHQDQWSDRFRSNCLDTNSSKRCCP